MFSHHVLYPAQTESSADNSEDDMIDTESSASEHTAANEAGKIYPFYCHAICEYFGYRFRLRVIGCKLRLFSSILGTNLAF